MTAPFKIGDIAIGQHFVAFPELNGMECQVIDELTSRTGTNPRKNMTSTGLRYVVRWSSGFETQAGPAHLRRRKPPTTGESSILAMFITSPQKKGVTA